MCIVYFDQLSGTARIRKLVEIHNICAHPLDGLYIIPPPGGRDENISKKGRRRSTSEVDRRPVELTFSSRPPGAKPSIYHVANTT